jgi:uncharacterized protein YdhG (YjbR/CyaY superfamily)
MAKPKNNDEYLQAVSDEKKRKALERLRETIRKAAPGAEEALVYGVAGFRLNGKPLAAFAAFTNHCGFYPLSPTVIEAHEEELRAFSIAKGTVRFTPEAPIKAALVRKLVKARAKEISG